MSTKKRLKRLERMVSELAERLGELYVVAYGPDGMGVVEESLSSALKKDVN